MKATLDAILLLYLFVIAIFAVVAYKFFGVTGVLWFLAIISVVVCWSFWASYTPKRHTVIDAKTGQILLDRVKTSEFKRCIQANWSKPESEDDVAPELRSAFRDSKDSVVREARGEFRLVQVTHFVVCNS